MNFLVSGMFGLQAFMALLCALGNNKFGTESAYYLQVTGYVPQPFSHILLHAACESSKNTSCAVTCFANVAVEFRPMH